MNYIIAIHCQGKKIGEYKSEFVPLMGDILNIGTEPKFRILDREILSSPPPHVILHVIDKTLIAASLGDK